MTPMCVACAKGYANIVEVLLDNLCIDLNKYDEVCAHLIHKQHNTQRNTQHNACVVQQQTVLILVYSLVERLFGGHVTMVTLT